MTTTFHTVQLNDFTTSFITNKLFYLLVLRAYTKNTELAPPGLEGH